MGKRMLGDGDAAQHSGNLLYPGFIIQLNNARFCVSFATGFNNAKMMIGLRGNLWQVSYTQYLAVG